MKNRLQKEIAMTKHLLASQQGSALIIMIVAMVLLSYATSTVLQQRGNDIMYSNLERDRSQARYTAISAIEYGKFQLDQGNSPAINNKTLDISSFSITADPATSTFEVTSQAGSARVQNKVDSVYSKNCFSMSPVGASISIGAFQTSMSNLQLSKTCHSRAVIDKVRVSWNTFHGSQRITSIRDNGVSYYSAFPVVGSPIGGAASGVTIDVQDYVLSSATPYVLDEIRWTYLASDAIATSTLYTFEFIFKDNSSVSFTATF
jgi:Tfp pilus assembly protein PilX